jgi:hypothetical protein
MVAKAVSKCDDVTGTCTACSLSTALSTATSTRMAAVSCRRELNSVRCLCVSTGSRRRPPCPLPSPPAAGGDGGGGMPAESAAEEDAAIVVVVVSLAAGGLAADPAAAPAVARISRPLLPARWGGACLGKPMNGAALGKAAAWLLVGVSVERCHRLQMQAVSLTALACFGPPKHALARQATCWKCMDSGVKGQQQAWSVVGLRLHGGQSHTHMKRPHRRRREF